MTLLEETSDPTSTTKPMHVPWVTPLLDDLEEWLPTPADRLLGLQRSMTRLGFSVLSTATKTISDSIENVVGTGRTGARTVTGQARSAVERTVEAGTTGTKEVLGQARAQAERTVATAESEVDDIADQVEASAPSRGYEQWTRADLYARAQDLEIDGRSGMDKSELISALTAHETV